jgi:predicted ATPase
MSAPAIRTPDQRLRVFVSSTLQELAEERKAARQGIERIHLTPVMFEAAARAHPPRDLYRAYLAQSDVFVGIYGARYGWIAPGADISGIEDEYRLSAGMPRLVYVKETSDREPRLAKMLERIEGDDLSYRFFREASELAELVARDLSLVLTERFATNHAPAETADAAPLPKYLPPIEQGEIIGREALVDDIARRLAPRSIVTLTGGGGTGKTSLAIHVANTVGDDFPDGVFYVSLAAVRDARDVVQTIATTLELPIPDGRADPSRLVAGFLRTRRALLVLDNFEQVIDAAPEVAALAAACRDLAIVITSRKPLRIRGEQEVPIPPLELGDDGPAVRLFEARARAVRPSFAVTDENRAAVVAICRHLDGLPLAIELAAARTRVLTPRAMLPRLDHSLALLTGGAKDLPERHQTLRRTLAWSFELLGDRERSAFLRLGVCPGSFGLGMAEAVIGDAIDGEVLDVVDSLVEHSLVVRTDDRDEPRFHMLATVREFACESLASADEARDAQRRLAIWASRFLAAPLPRVARFQTIVHYERFLTEEHNVRAALTWCLGENGDLQLGWRIAADYALMLFVHMRLREVAVVFDQATAAGPCTDEVVHAKARVARGATAAVTYDMQTAREFLGDVAATLRAAGEREAAGWAETAWAQIHLLTGDLDIMDRLERAVGEFQAAGSVNGEVFVRSLQAFVALQSGDVSRAHELATAALEIARERRDDDKVALLTSGFGRLALIQGNLDEARAWFANAAAIGQVRSGRWGRFGALMLLASVMIAQRDDEAARGVLEDVVQTGRVAGLGYGVELALGGLAGLAVRRGEIDRAALMFQLVPEGYEDGPDLAMVHDPLGTLRAETRAAREALGPRAKGQPDRHAMFDEVLDQLFGRGASS